MNILQSLRRALSWIGNQFRRLLTVGRSAPQSFSSNRNRWTRLRHNSQSILIGLLLVVIIVSGLIALRDRSRKANGYFSLTSSAIDNEVLPAEFTCSGNDINPPFEFNKVPSEAQSLALWAENLDMTKEEKKLANNSLWLIFNIPPTATQVVAGIRPPGTITRNYKGNFNYNGPCPEPGKKARVVFHLEALDVPLLPVNSTASLAEFQKATKSHVIAKTELEASFSRSK